MFTLSKETKAPITPLPDLNSQKTKKIMTKIKNCGKMTSFSAFHYEFWLECEHSD